MKRLAVCLALTASPAYAEMCTPATDAELEVIREALEPELFDARSARFQDVCSIPGHEYVEGDRVFCGLVNSKDRTGNYMGYMDFSYVSGARSATVVDPSGDDFLLEYSHCLVCTPAADCDELLD